MESELDEVTEVREAGGGGRNQSKSSGRLCLSCIMPMGS